MGGPREELAAAVARLVEAGRHFQRTRADAEGLPGLPQTSLPVLLDESRVEATTRTIITRIESELADAARRARAIAAGSVFCLSCRSAVCEHAAPPAVRDVFAGWGPSGRPIWVDFAQLLLDRGDPRVDRLYATRPLVLAHTLRTADLRQRLLEAFEAPSEAPEVLGQVCAGWFRVRLAGTSTLVALTLQLLTLGRRRERRFLLHPVAGAELREEWGVLENPPWEVAIRSGRDTLASIEAFSRRPGVPWARVLERVDSVLGELAEDLERPERARLRRTEHAEQRHQAGERPTPTALADLARCAPEKFLHDPRHGTFVVIGAKGRTHFFAEDGRLVSSVRYGPQALARRVESGRWQPAPLAARDQLLERASGAG